MMSSSCSRRLQISCFLSPACNSLPSIIWRAADSIAPRIPPGLTWAMGDGQTTIEKGHRHRNGKWEIGNGKWDIYRTSPEHPTNIDRTFIEHPLKIHRRYIEDGNASNIHDISSENPLKSTENWKSKETQARIHAKFSESPSKIHWNLMKMENPSKTNENPAQIHENSP